MLKNNTMTLCKTYIKHKHQNNIHTNNLNVVRKQSMYKKKKKTAHIDN